MNTLHYKKISKKKKIYLIKIKSNQTKWDKIFEKNKKIKIFKNEIFENKIFVENNILNAKLIVLHYL